MKKLFIVLAAVASISLAACGGKDKGAPTTPVTTEPTATEDVGGAGYGGEAYGGAAYGAAAAPEAPVAE